VAGCRDAVGSIDQRFDLAVEILRIGFEAQKQKQAGVGIFELRRCLPGGNYVRPGRN
jgi:hypothetical protein